MNANHAELLQRLNQFNLDSPDSTFPFSSRLAKENLWSPAYARRVIEEYKRFAFLGVAAGHPVSPSEDVDQAWHLHLTYSQSYWREFCPEVLRQPFHHQPTKGGEAEHSKFQDWYARTLESYEKFFGAKPPGDIWPSPEERQKTRPHFVRVDRNQHWILRKPRLRLSPEIGLTMGLALLVVFGTGAMFANGWNPFDWRGPDFLKFYVVQFILCFSLALWFRRTLRLPAANAQFDESQLTAYDLAYLNGGKILAVNSAIANLIREKVLRIDAADKRLLAGNTPPSKTSELERVIHRAASRSGGEKISEVRMAAKTTVGEIADKLKALGLVVADGQATKATTFPMLLAVASIGMGIIKILIGLQRDKPVGYLIALCFISGVISLVALARTPLRSRFGDEFLARLKTQHAKLKTSLGRSSMEPAMFAMGLALFGMSALDGTPYDGLRRELQPPASGGGDGGCGSSCGGGCGGGCGGCGGGD